MYDILKFMLILSHGCKFFLVCDSVACSCKTVFLIHTCETIYTLRFPKLTTFRPLHTVTTFQTPYHYWQLPHFFNGIALTKEWFFNTILVVLESAIMYQWLFKFCHSNNISSGLFQGIIKNFFGAKTKWTKQW